MLSALLAAVAFFYGFMFSIGGTFVLMPLLAPMALLVLVAVWLLPSTDKAPLGWVERLMFVFLVAVICWPNYLALALPGMPWITAIRLVVTPLAGLFVISLSISPTFQKTLKEILSAAPVVWKLLAGFMVIALLSIPTSSSVANSLNKFVVAQLYWTLIFLVSCYVFSIPGNSFRLGRLLWISLAFVCLIGVWEWQIQRLPWAGHIPSFLKVDDELLQGLLAGGGRAATGIYRVKSVFTTPLGLGEYLALATPFVLYLMLTRPAVWVKVAGVVTVVLVFTTLIRADTRLGVIGFFSSMLLTFLAWGALKWRRDRQNILAQGLVLIYPAIFVLFIISTFFVRRLEVMVWGSGAQAASTDARKIQIAMGMPKILKQPWGHGIGQGGEALGFYSPGGILTIDTYYLAVALEYGVIGFLLYYGLFLYVIYRGGRALLVVEDRNVEFLMPICIALINFVVIKSVFSQESNHPIVFALLGAAVALIYRSKMLGSDAGQSPVGSGPRLAAARDSV